MRTRAAAVDQSHHKPIIPTTASVEDVDFS